MKTTQEQINDLAGREIEFTQLKNNLYVPIYVNFNLKTKISEIAAPSLEEAQNNFLKFLKELEPQGDINEPEDNP